MINTQNSDIKPLCGH